MEQENGKKEMRQVQQIEMLSVAHTTARNRPKTKQEREQQQKKSFNT